MTLSNSEKFSSESASSDAATLDALAAFIGFFSLVLVIILTTLKLLLEPGMALLSVNESVDPFSLELWLDYAVFFGAIVLVLLVATRFNDVLIANRDSAGKLLVYTALGMGLIGCLVGFLGAPSAVVLGLAAVAISLFVLIWGIVLSTINSVVLTFMLMLASVLGGIIVVLDTQFSSSLTFVILGLLYIISGQAARLISPARLARIAPATRRQSHERHVRGKGNSFTLLLVGSMFGITAILVRSLGLTAQELAPAMGICLLISGLILALFYRDLHTHLGNGARRLLALILALGLIPYPFVGSTGQLVCVCFLFIAGTINLVLIVDSILETSRFNQISPFWIIGLEGSIFFAGVLAVLLCAAACMTLLNGGLEILLFALVAVASVLQIYSNNQAYPLFRSSETSAGAQTQATAVTGDLPIASGQAEMPGLREQAEMVEMSVPEITVHYSALWRHRVDEIAEEYRLTTRQKEIMELLIMGRDLHYITVRLQISRPTAKTHLSNLYRKMNLHSKQELIDLMEPIEQMEARP
ncbi:MAG: helix-turn-helix transcriptional regulator [Coriobacteriales bacterium]|jgi:DNA-binding CsgD family transcriptional regulator|nr:helix-turn-helix transcriptional regulator [Coriobacteriales bacterium]